MDEYFKIIKINKILHDEDGEKTGYNLYKIKLPENYPKVLNKIIIQTDNYDYKYTAIPILDKVQTYYIKPTHISWNLNLVNEMNLLKNYVDNKIDEDINNYVFYNIDDKTFEIKSKFDILSYLGYIQVGKAFVLGKYVSESGITKFKPMFQNRKKIIPSRFKNDIDKINHNSWILTVLYSLNYNFVDEKSRKYITSYVSGIHLKESFDKLIEIGYLFKNNGKIYDVYMLFDLFDPSYTEFIHDCFNLGNSLDDIKIKSLFNKYQINFDEKKENFEKLYANIVGYYISVRFEDLLDDQEANKLKILRFLGLDYKT